MTLATTPDLLAVHDLRMSFRVGGSLVRGGSKSVHAVDGVSFSIRQGETLALVGESGCGKTTVGRLIARLLEPTGGRIYFAGQDITHLHGKPLRRFRPHVQMVFQDPYTSLNPRLSIGNIVAEPLRINRYGTETEIRQRVGQLLEAVGLSAQHAHRLPREFSGGQRQRIAIARALALKPRLVVCDEPVSALDMSIQAKILNLLVDLQREFQLTYLFISHDLSVVRLIADRVAVMYMGQIVEIGPTEAIFANPLHPYTQALIAAIPDPYERRGVNVLPGEVPSNVNLPPGCRFHTRCPARMAVCNQRAPVLQEIDPEHQVACFLHETIVETSA